MVVRIRDGHDEDGSLYPSGLFAREGKDLSRLGPAGDGRANAAVGENNERNPPLELSQPSSPTRARISRLIGRLRDNQNRSSLRSLSVI